MTHSYPTASLTRTAAAALIDAARASAEAMGVEVAVAVTDPGGHLKAFERTDGAAFLTVEVAVNKAWTAASYNLDTRSWNEYLQNDPRALSLAYLPRLTAIPGGFPVRENGLLIGGLGISGGNAAQDQEIAEAALKSLGLDAPA